MKSEIRLYSGNGEPYRGTLLPGSYTLRAAWLLYGCTEGPDEKDCLAPLQKEDDIYAEVFKQQAVEVFSESVRAESPTPPNPGTMKFTFEVSSIGASISTKVAKDLREKCAAHGDSHIECVVFHYKIRNTSTEPVRMMNVGCNDLGTFPEWFAGDEWRPVVENLGCTLNVGFEIAILPGETYERDFSIAWGYDLKPFQHPGEYKFRLLLQPYACIASPDGSFCIANPESTPPIPSKELSVRLD